MKFELFLSLTSLLTGVVYAAPIAPPNENVLGYYSPTPTPPPSIGPIIKIEILEKYDGEEVEDERDTTTDPPRARATPV